MVLSSYWLPPKAPLSECPLNLGTGQHGLYHLITSQAQVKHNVYLDESKRKIFLFSTNEQNLLNLCVWIEFIL